LYVATNFCQAGPCSGSTLPVLGLFPTPTAPLPTNKHRYYSTDDINMPESFSVGHRNNTRVTINAPVFFMEREVMDFWREICITRASYRGGPQKVESGPTPITGPSNAYFPPEIHYFPLHKKHRCIGNFFNFNCLLGIT
jgi:hypothetical protein